MEGKNKHRENQVKLILMLYDGVIKLLQEPLDRLQEKRYDVVNDSLVQAQKILTELMLSLDLDVGETALNLFILYDSFHEKLVEANVQKNGTLINEVKDTLIGLRKIWEEASLLDISTIEAAQKEEPATNPQEQPSDNNQKGTKDGTTRQEFDF